MTRTRIIEDTARTVGQRGVEVGRRRGVEVGRLRGVEVGYHFDELG